MNESLAVVPNDGCPVAPEDMVGKVATVGDVRLQILGADYADSNLPVRGPDGARRKLANVIKTTVQAVDDSGEPVLVSGAVGGPAPVTVEPMDAYLCRYCAGLWWKKGQVTNHLASEHPGAIVVDTSESEEPPKARRIYIPNDIKTMTLQQMLDVLREYDRLKSETEALRGALAEEKAKRRDATAAVAGIRRALGSVMETGK